MENESGFLPTGDRVVVRLIKVEETTAGGIVLPDVLKAKEQIGQNLGHLLAAGPDAEESSYLHFSDGAAIELGDLILFARHSGADFPLNGVTYRIMRVGDVVGKVTKLPDFMLKGDRSSVDVFGINRTLETKAA